MDPLRTVQQAIDQTFGEDYARQHPELVAGVLIAAGLRDIAEALLVEDEPVNGPGIVRAHGLLRP